MKTSILVVENFGSNPKWSKCLKTQRVILLILFPGCKMLNIGFKSLKLIYWLYLVMIVVWCDYFSWSLMRAETVLAEAEERSRWGRDRHPPEVRVEEGLPKAEGRKKIMVLLGTIRLYKIYIKYGGNYYFECLHFD